MNPDQSAPDLVPSGFPQALEIMENPENYKKVPCMEKSWNSKKPEYSWKNHGIFEII